MDRLAPIGISLYAALMVVGGVMGYATAKSVYSLVAGILSGLLLGVALFLHRTQPKAGLGLATLVALGLTVVFLERYLKTHKIMPSGMLIAVSVVAALFFGLAWRKGGAKTG